MGLGQTTTILVWDEDGIPHPVSADHPLPTTGGSGGGAVDSVNGQTGVVVLDAGDVNARPDDWEPDLSAYATTASLPAAVASNESLQSIVGGDNVTVDDTDPRNPVINASGGGGGDVASVNGQTGEVVLNSSNIDVVFGGTTIGQLNDSLQSLTESVTGLDSTKLNTPTGTASATTYAAGDGTWKTPPNTTYNVVTQANIENPASTTSGLVTGQRLAQGVAANLPENLVQSDNASVIGIERYASEDDLPTTGVVGVLYVVPVVAE